MLKSFRSWFFRGMAALLPTVLTIWLFVQCYKFVHENISTELNRGVVRVIVLVSDHAYYPTPEEKLQFASEHNIVLPEQQSLRMELLNREGFVRDVRIWLAEQYWVYGPGQVAGLLLALIGVCFIGAFLASVVGRAMWRKFEHFITVTPVLRRIYPYIKQITDFFLTQNKLTFTRVAAVEYPRKGIWSIALVTGSGLQAINKQKAGEWITVFIPSSPTPFTGYVIMLPKEDVLILDITIEQALRFTISGGVITPMEQQAYEQLKAVKKEDKE